MATRYETGVHSKTAETIAVGGASTYIGFNPAKFVPTDRNSRGVSVGATKGGSQISVEKTYHQSDVDGVITTVLGLEWLTEANVKADVNLLEMTKENFELALGAFKSRSYNSDYDIIEHTGSLEQVSVGDVAFFTNLKGRDYPVIHVIRDAVVTSNLEYDSNNGKDDVVLKVTLEGRVNPDKDIYKIPYYIMYPKNAVSPTATPSANVQSGAYDEAQSVALTAQVGAQIFYTTDGSIPTPDNGTLYTAPINVDTTMTIKAVAVFDARLSTVLELNYTINP